MSTPVAPSPSFAHLGRVSLWLSTVSLGEVPDGYLEGAPEVLAWLFVDFGVAVDGAFSTNYTDDHELGDLRPLLEPLHASEAFVDEAVTDGAACGLGRASFVIALYDLAYEPERLGLSPHPGTPELRYLGSYGYG